jgi:quercetin dioxygenase-like cupin family protein
VGSVTWRIYDDLNSDTYKEYDLVTGDAIWVPSGVSHEVIAKEPRTAITIAFEGNE